MEDGNKHKDGAENEPKGSTSEFCRDDDLSYDLFARLLIKRIVGFLEMRPSDFAITILPPALSLLDSSETTSDGEEGGVQPTGNESAMSLSLESLSSEDRSLLETSIVLMHEPGGAFKPLSHLGLEARKLPFVARVLRKAYRQAKKNSQNVSSRSSSANEELFHVTSCLLLIQPDHATAWADRRRCLLSLRNREVQSLNSLAFDYPGNSVDEDDEEEDDEKDEFYVLWSKELDYLDILFTQHSKAPSSWAHRKYALRQMLQRIESSYDDHGNLEKKNKTKDILFAREVKTSIDVAEKYPKNYYAWTHRRYLWDLFSFEAGDETKRQQQRLQYIQLLETELMIGMWQEWLPRHPGDHSAVHYSCQVLDLLLKEMISLQLDSGRVMLDEKIESASFSALDQVRVLLTKFSHENESLWILRRTTYKILWKHLYHPSVAAKCLAKAQLFTEMTALVCLLIRTDLKIVLSSTLDFDVEHDENNSECIHAWTFLAWCIVNVDGIDDYPGRAEYNFNPSTDDIIFTPRVREIASRYLTSTTGATQHNHLVYTSPSSPFTKVLAKGATKA